MTLIPNPLNKFRSYNYRWSLGVLSSSDLANPNSYRSNGGNLLFIRSGGLPQKRIKTSIEEKLGINVEYFIDDVVIESIGNPNIQTSTSTAVTFEFTVTEPYSIGLFFQTLIIAANQGGYTNYIEAPYVLSVDFIGHTDNDKIETTSRKSYAIKLTQVSLTANGSGSVYKINAIAWNHIGFLDDYQHLTKTINSSGRTVAEVLTNFTVELNKQEADKVKERSKLVGNQYNIVFPLDIATGVSASTVPNNNITPGSISADSSRFQVVDAIRQSEKLFVYQQRAASQFNAGQNYIGNSLIAPSFNEFGKIQFANENESYDEALNIIKDSNFSIDENIRKYEFNSGTKIEKIIEAVILSSEWGKNLINQSPDTNNMIDWFKIDSTVKILSTDEMRKNGRPAMSFEYRVTPYKMNVSVVSQPTAEIDYSSALSNVAKGYRYTYTGLNEDVINFEFTINNSFYKPLVDLQSTPDNSRLSAFNEPKTQFGVTPEAPGAGRSGFSTVQPSLSAIQDAASDRQLIAKAQQIQEIQRNNLPYRYETTASGDAKVVTNKQKLAELFNIMILNSDTDNVVLELEIWGDPYYLSDSDSGNYRAPPGSLYINADSAIDFQRSEIDILVSFNSAVDYKNNLMIIDPDTVFSGIYKITTFTSTFSQGRFTQQLKLLRRPGQNKNTIDLVNKILGNVSVEITEQTILEQLSNANQNFDKLFSILPNELQKFTRLGQLGIALSEKLSPIVNALSQAENLISVGNQIRNDIRSLLGSVQSQPDGIQSLFSGITEKLTDPTLLSSQITQGSVQDAAKKALPPSVRTALDRLENNKPPTSSPVTRTSTVSPLSVLPGDPTKKGGPR